MIVYVLLTNLHVIASVGRRASRMQRAGGRQGFFPPTVGSGWRFREGFTLELDPARVHLNNPLVFLPDVIGSPSGRDRWSIGLFPSVGRWAPKLLCILRELRDRPIARASCLLRSLYSHLTSC